MRIAKGLKTLRLAVLATVLVSSFFSGATVQKASALAGSEFNPGRIIDDEIFFNGGGMSASDIQKFLDSKMPNCDTNGAQPRYGSSGQTRKQWAEANGQPTPPYVCLRNFKQNVSGVAPDTYCAGGIGSGQKTAAQIINDVAKACSINPKVILVLLQKEQSLITDDWPWPNQYTKATGFGCPDSDLPSDVDGNDNGCYDDTEGFFNQIYYGARQYQRYSKQANLFSYKAGRNNYIQYNPNAACGGSDIYITNQATAGLYNYTPYQPNAEALNNLYGTGSDCSAYGNRNFWRLYSEWFGPTTTDFSWDPDLYQVWNVEETQRLDPGKLYPGTTYVAKVYAVNNGSATWRRSGPSPAYLGTSNPDGQDSWLCHRNWVACDRAGRLMNETVPAGAGGDFKFTFRVPYQTGSYREYFKPVSEHVSWFNGGNESLGFKVVSPGTFTWSTSGFKIMNEAKTTFVDPGNLKPNTRYFVVLDAKNTGSAVWYNNQTIPVRLGTDKGEGHMSELCDTTTWRNCARPATLKESRIKPNETGTFEFFIKTPTKKGSYREYFKPVAENFKWFNEGNDSLGIVVR